jgi:hypothetical protein
MAINFRRFTSGIQIVPRPDGSTATTLQGELAVSSVDGNIYYNTGTSTVILDGTSSTNTLTNKTIAVGANHITSTPNTVAQFNASTGDLESSVTTDAELAFVHGVTSNIQAQLNAISSASISSLTGDVVATGPGAATATIQANVVDNSKLAQAPALTIKGNNTGSTANEQDLTVAQVNAILPIFTSTLNGLVPASGGGTTNFLRADGAWAVAGSGSVTSVALTVPSFLAVSGSPITSTGTFGVTLSGTALPVTSGGTGDITFNPYSVIYSGTTSTGPFSDSGGPGTAGYILTSNGASSYPTFQPAPGTVSAFYASSPVTTASTAVTTTTFTTFSNSPAFTFTPSITGTYKVYSNPSINQGTQDNEGNVRVFNTSGGGGGTLAQNVGAQTTNDLLTGSSSRFNLSQNFVPSSTAAPTTASFSLSYDTNPLTSGNMQAYIYTDVAGSPGSLIATSASQSVTTLTSSPSTYTFTFSSAPTLTSGTTYHIVFGLTSIVLGSSAGIDVYDSAPNGIYTAVQNFNGSIWVTNSGRAMIFNVIAPSGGTPAVLLEESIGEVFSSTSNMMATAFCQSVYTLTAGTTYVFDLQGRTSGGNLVLNNGTATFYMFAELETTGSLPLQVSSINSLSGSVTFSGSTNIVLTQVGNNIDFSMPGPLPIANGGTNNGALSVVAGGVIYSDGTKLQNTGAGTSGYVLTSNGSSAPSFQPGGGGSTSVAASVNLASSISVSSGSPIIYDTVNFDTNSAYSTSTGLYTVPVSGNYLVTATGFAGGSGVSIYVQVNATPFAYLANVTSVNGGSTIVAVNSGDTIRITPNTTETFTGGAAPYLNSFSVAKV